MPQKKNAPGRKAEGVDCQLAGDIDANITSLSQTQFLLWRFAFAAIARDA